MNRLLALMAAGVAVLTVGVLLSFAAQTDPDEPRDPTSPAAAQQPSEPYVSPSIAPSVQGERLDVLAPPRPMDPPASAPEDQPPIVVPEGGPEQEPGPNPAPIHDPVRQGSPSESQTTSGIEGQVTLGPTRPGPEWTGDPPSERPYQATISVLDQAGNLVTRFETDADGRFQVALPPGTYTVQPESPRRLPFGKSQLVTVSAGQFTPVAIRYDTGMR